MSHWPVFVINLKRSSDRWNKINSLFPSEKLIRIDAIDGREWESGECDDTGKPQFKEGVALRLYLRGIFGKSSRDIYPWIPAEVGCAMSHIKVWDYIIENKIERAIILEDDAEPTVHLSSTIQESVESQLGVPEDADVIFLDGADNEYGSVSIDDENKLKGGFGNTGYVITLRGAKTSRRAQLPMYFPCDIQWWARAFKGIDIYINTPLAEMGKIQAYAMTNGVVDINSNTWTTTMTPHGKKPWKMLPYERNK